MFALPALGGQTPQARPVETLHPWPDFIRRQNSLNATLPYCQRDAQACYSQGLARWAELLSDLDGQNALRQLATVNRWFNRIPYKYDELAFGETDYWADTQEFIDYKGDCEDYALAKYFSLRQLGFPAEGMKVVMVYDSQNYSDHAVLVVTRDGARFVLDNNTDSTDPTVLGTRYKPVYAFNETGAWIY